MREHIERISKHVDRIKEIVWNDKDMLDWDTSNMSEEEIHKMSEVWKAANSIENYNIMAEYSRFKQINKYIRLWYFAIIWFIIWFIVLISADYIQVKIENKSVSEIQKNKETLEKSLLIAQENLEKIKTQNNEFNSLLAQKDNNIKELNKEIEEIKWQMKENKFDSDNKKISIEESKSQWELIKETTKENPNQDSLNKKCSAKVWITINLREKAGLDSNVITFLSEWTEVEVMKEQFLDWRNWYQVVTSKYTWWIANIWIENFDNTCLKQ